MDRILQVFQKELICSICRNYFIDPITINCGHSFCRPCFNLNWPNRSVLAYCSECRKAIQKREFHTNVTLKEMVLIVRQASLWQFLRSRNNRCRIHMEARQIFCEDQRSLFCLHCSTSQQHGAHRHGSVEEAAEQLREKLLKTMCSVWEKCRENDRNLNVETVTTRSWKDFGDILHKSEAVCEYMPQPVKAELTAVTIPGMMARFNHLQMNITLQHRSTPDHVFLQGDLINLRVGCGSQGAPYTSPLAECFYHWDAQTFTTGRHYWEIAVGDTCDWALGVSCNDWVQENVHLHKAFYLLGCAETDMHHKVFTTSPHLLQYVPRPTGRVGIFLDYEGRSVTFVNVAKRTLICRIDFCSFSSHLRPILCCSHF
uniref:Tripartite motif containing 77 n=1 Tax=Pipistrellus kuhlii TaxID=59472 RepID=A0A7J7X353_PIPKU|nr:hypothetical protein mPipKuh1_018038 [Pipistrellus kuhlii]